MTERLVYEALAAVSDVYPMHIGAVNRELYSRFSCSITGNASSIMHEGFNHIASLIYGRNNIAEKLNIRKVFIENPEASNSDILKAIADACEHEAGTDKYNLITVYTNTDISKLRLLGFTKEKKTALLELFKGLREEARNQGYYLGEEELITDAIYKHKETNTYVFFTNSYANVEIRRASNIEYLNGYCFKNVKEQVLTLLLPVLFPEIKELLNEQELYILEKLSNIYRFNTGNVHKNVMSLLNSEKYKDFINKILRKGIEANLIATRKRTFERKQESYNRNIADLTRRLEQEENALQSLLRDMFYLQTKADSITEQLDYVYDHPLVNTINMSTVYAGGLCLTVRLPISLWDPEIANNLFENLENIFNSNHTAETLRPYIACFFEEIFLKQSAEYYIQSVVDLDLLSLQSYRIREHNNISSNESLSICKAIEAGYNPHLEFYGCVGTYAQHIREALRGADLAIILEAVLSPLKNWNLADGAVLSRAMQEMFPTLINNDIKCIKYNDKMMTIKELYICCNTYIEEVEGDELLD